MLYGRSVLKTSFAIGKYIFVLNPFSVPTNFPRCKKLHRQPAETFILDKRVLTETSPTAQTLCSVLDVVDQTVSERTHSCLLDMGLVQVDSWGLQYGRSILLG